MAGGGKMELWVGKCRAECVRVLHCCYMLDCEGQYYQYFQPLCFVLFRVERDIEEGSVICLKDKTTRNVI